MRMRDANTGEVITGLDIVRGFLAEGMRINAADSAEALAKTTDVEKLRELAKTNDVEKLRALVHILTNDVEKLRALVHILAEGMREVGNNYQTAGKPKTRSIAQAMAELNLVMAVNAYYAAILARRWVAGGKLSAEELSELALRLGVGPDEADCYDHDESYRRTLQAFVLDEHGARDALKPHARELLAGYGLLPKGEALQRRVCVPKRGFSAAAQQIIGTHFGVKESSLNRELTRLRKLTQ